MAPLFYIGSRNKIEKFICLTAGGMNKMNEKNKEYTL